MSTLTNFESLYLLIVILLEGTACVSLFVVYFPLLLSHYVSYAVFPLIYSVLLCCSFLQIFRSVFCHSVLECYHVLLMAKSWEKNNRRGEKKKNDDVERSPARLWLNRLFSFTVYKYSCCLQFPNLDWKWLHYSISMSKWWFVSLSRRKPSDCVEQLTRIHVTCLYDILHFTASNNVMACEEVVVNVTLMYWPIGINSHLDRLVVQSRREEIIIKEIGL